MSHDINSTLEKLEQNLKDIDSARQQVENTVKDSSKLQSVVEEYVSSFSRLHAEIQSWQENLKTLQKSKASELNTGYSGLKTGCSDILAAFNSDVKKIATDFNAKSEKSISDLTDQNNNLAACVKELNTLFNALTNTASEIQDIKTTVSHVASDLQKSQKDQNLVLDDINHKTQEIPSDIKAFSDNIGDQIEVVGQDLKKILDTTNAKIAEVKIEIDNLTGLESKTNALCGEVKSSTSKLDDNLHAFSDSLTNLVSSSEDSIQHGIKMNRLILIIGILLLAVLQFIIK